MGEISDALRIARRQKPAAEPAPARNTGVGSALRRALGGAAAKRPAAPAEPAPSLAKSRRRPGAAARPLEAEAAATFESLAPANPAIVSFSDGEYGDACRNLAVRLQLEMERNDVRSAAILSAVAKEGKTTVSCNLALALASLSAERRIALVDLDLRKPSVGPGLGITAEAGMGEVLNGEIPIEKALVRIGRPRIDVLPSVGSQRDAHELLVSSRMSEIMLELQERYDLVLIDTPPTLLFPDAALVLRYVQAGITVARCGHSRRRLYQKMLETLPRDRLIWRVLNGGRVPRFSHYYRSRYYHHDETEAAVEAPEAQLR